MRMLKCIGGIGDGQIVAVGENQQYVRVTEQQRPSLFAPVGIIDDLVTVNCEDYTPRIIRVDKEVTFLAPIMMPTGEALELLLERYSAPRNNDR